MHIFLTGATGYIGSAVLDAMLKGGHRVTAIARDPEKAEKLLTKGATPVIAELGLPKLYLPSLMAADAVVHTAFESSPRAVQVDQLAIETMLAAQRDALAADGKARAFLYTSGVWVLGRSARAADEDSPLEPPPHVAWRPAHENQVLAAASAGVRPVVIRPGIVYGGGRGIVADLIKDALNGIVRVVGPGKNRWPCVYDRDLGDLYARLLASTDASGVFHAAGDEDECVFDIAEAIRSHVDPVADIRFMPLTEARAKMGPYADALALDQVVRCPHARATGWSPAMHGITGNAPRLFEEYRRAASRE